MRLFYLVGILFFAGLAVLPANQSKKPPILRKEIKVDDYPKNVNVVIDEGSRVYLDGKEVCWPLLNFDVEVEKLILDQSNHIIEVRFRSLKKMPKGQEKGPK